MSSLAWFAGRGKLDPSRRHRSNTPAYLNLSLTLHSQGTLPGMAWPGTQHGIRTCPEVAEMFMLARRSALLGVEKCGIGGAMPGPATGAGLGTANDTDFLESSMTLC